MVTTVEQLRTGTGAGTSTEMVGRGTTGGCGAAAPMGHPTSDSIESMASSQPQTQESSPASTPSYVDSAMDFLRSIGTSIYNFANSTWNSLLKFLGY